MEEMDGGWEAAGKELEALLVNNRELERLENIADGFNACEALGIVNRENSHSDFPSFLLDPKANHGLSDLFARRFLQAALLAPGDATPPRVR
jgi:hypothetical protein